MIILGINAYHGDVSAVVFRDGELIQRLGQPRRFAAERVAGRRAKSRRLVSKAKDTLQAIPILNCDFTTYDSFYFPKY